MIMDMVYTPRIDASLLFIPHFLMEVECRLNNIICSAELFDCVPSILFISILDDKHVGLVSYVWTKVTFRYIHKSQYLEVIKSNILSILLIRFITKIGKTR